MVVVTIFKTWLRLWNSHGSKTQHYTPQFPSGCPMGNCRLKLPIYSLDLCQSAVTNLLQKIRELCERIDLNWVITVLDMDATEYVSNEKTPNGLMKTIYHPTKGWIKRPREKYLIILWQVSPFCDAGHLVPPPRFGPVWYATWWCQINKTQCPRSVLLDLDQSSIIQGKGYTW